MRFKKEYDTFKCGHALATTRETWDTCNSVWEKRLKEERTIHERECHLAIENKEVNRLGYNAKIVDFIDKFLEDSK